VAEHRLETFQSDIADSKRFEASVSSEARVYAKTGSLALALRTRIRGGES
jgi:hypothetical protein